MTSRLGSFRLGGESLAGSWVRNPPSATITAPGSTIDTTTVSVSWSYASPIPRAQSAYRVKLQNQDRTVTLYDSTILSGAGTSHVPAYTLSPGSTYTVVVAVFDGADWSGDATQLVTVEATDSAEVAVVKTVGSVYEVAINGVGYMLADQPGTDFQYRRQTVPLDSPRFSTGDTPFSQAVERYTFVGWSDFRDGAGQRYRNRDTSSGKAFWQSEGVNPFDEEGLKLLPATAQTLATAHTNPLATVASSKLYVLTGAKQITEVPSIGGSPSAFSVAAAGTFSAVASDGEYWYAADGVDVYRNNSAADPTTAWSTIDAKVMAWAGDRICVAYPSTGSTPNTFSTLAPDGTEEVGSGRLVLPVGASITSIVGGDGYVWFSAKRGQQGLVYAWQAGSSDSPFLAFEFPAGQFPQALGFYLGNLFVRCAEPLSGGGARAIVYRCAVSEGRIAPQLVTDFDSGTDDHTVGAWGGDDRFGLFSWKKQAGSGASGLGAIDLSTGGWAKWLYAPSASATGDVVSVVTWNGRTVFSVAGYGVCHETTTALSSGWLSTDIADLGTSIAKIFGELRLDCSPLPSNGTVTVAYTTDAGNSYAPDTSTLTGAGLQSLTVDLAKQAGSIGLKLTLAASGNSPVVRTVTVRSHPYGLADQVLVLPVNCADVLTDLQGRELRESGPGRGAARARVLESLVQSRVVVQDVDWPTTKASTVWEVQGVDIRSTLVKAPARNQAAVSQVAVCTLRRSFK